MPETLNTHLARHTQLFKAFGYIQNCQLASGAIPWFEGGKLDPWDHTEALMALAIGGDLSGSHKALDWLAQMQRQDGSWQANYFTDQQDHTVETNFVAYPATGLWHNYLISNNQATLNHFFPMIEKAITFVLSQQQSEGDIQWAIAPEKAPASDALLTACCSILRSLECAIAIAKTLKKPYTTWLEAYLRLARAIKTKPWRFDRTWESKARYSMDWFYPILTGIYSQQEARTRLEKRWTEFVEDGIGCRCVSNEPWMTVAESCELTLALIAAGQPQTAAGVYRQLSRWQDSDGGYWTGYNFRDDAIWPKEKTTWTAAAMILAADAIEKWTPAATLFTAKSTLFSRTLQSS